jgi:hypothetical protein
MPNTTASFSGTLHGLAREHDRARRRAPVRPAGNQSRATKTRAPARFLWGTSGERPGESATLTVLGGRSDAAGRVHFDPGHDFSTGDEIASLPVWPLHLLALLAALGFVGSGLAGSRGACRADGAFEEERPG